MESLCPPEMFALVEDSVFRSNDIRPANVAFMKSLGLRTIVYLSPEAPSRTLLSFADASSAELVRWRTLARSLPRGPAVPTRRPHVARAQVHLGAKPWHTPGWKPISDELVKEAIEMALDSTRHPIVFMCRWAPPAVERTSRPVVTPPRARAPRSSGVHVTGVIVGCLRRLQQWCLTSIIEEVRASDRSCPRRRP